MSDYKKQSVMYVFVPTGPETLADPGKFCHEVRKLMASHLDDKDLAVELVTPGRQEVEYRDINGIGIPDRMWERISPYLVKDAPIERKTMVEYEYTTDSFEPKSLFGEGFTWKDDEGFDFCSIPSEPVIWRSDTKWPELKGYHYFTVTYYRHYTKSPKSDKKKLRYKNRMVKLVHALREVLPSGWDVHATVSDCRVIKYGVRETCTHEEDF